MLAKWEAVENKFVRNKDEATQGAIHAALADINQNEERMRRLLRGIPENFRSKINETLENREREIFKLDVPKEGDDFKANQSRREAMLETLLAHQEAINKEILPSVRSFKKLYNECHKSSQSLREEIAQHNKEEPTHPLVSPDNEDRLNTAIDRIKNAASEADLNKAQQSLEKIDHQIDSDSRYPELSKQIRSDYFKEYMKREGAGRTAGNPVAERSALNRSYKERADIRSTISRAENILDKSRKSTDEHDASTSTTRAAQSDTPDVSPTNSRNSSGPPSPTGSESSVIDTHELREKLQQGREAEKDSEKEHSHQSGPKR